MDDTDSRNLNADGTLIATSPDGSTIHAELCTTTDGQHVARLNCTTTWDTWVGVELTAEQLRAAANQMLAFADQMPHA